MPYKQQMYIDWKETCKQLPELKDQQKHYIRVQCWILCQYFLIQYAQKVAISNINYEIKIIESLLNNVAKLYKPGLYFYTLWS